MKTSEIQDNNDASWSPATPLGRIEIQCTRCIEREAVRSMMESIAAGADEEELSAPVDEEAGRSVAELLGDAERLESGARRQLVDVVNVVDGQLQRLIAIYQSIRGDVPNLRIEREILQARSLIAELKSLTPGRQSS